MFYEHLKGHIEALLFASGEPLPAAKIADILSVPDEQHIILLIEEIKKQMNSESRGLTIVEVAGGFQICTN